MTVFLIMHLHLMGGFPPDAKMIGLFTDFDTVQRVINDCRRNPGFSEQPNNFYIKRVELPVTEAHTSAYVVSLYVHDQGYDVEYVDLVGVYSAVEEAAKKKLSLEMDNQCYLLGGQQVTEVTIDEYELNTQHWNEGYDSEPMDSIG